MTKEQNAISLSLAERKDLLVLAQQKLDSSNHSFAASNSVRASKKSNAASSLLSTLLYMALMSYKVEDMKAMLKHVDLESYESFSHLARTKKQQWDALLAVLHSPEFHVKERLLQNERVARTFERKNQYKATNSALKEQLTAQKAVWDRQLDTTSCKLEEVQQISNISLQTINSMQQEVSELNKKMHEAQAKIDLERKSVQCKDIAINDLNQQLVSANENALGTSTELCESKARVESIESQLEEKDIQINKMQQDLIKAEYSNASLSEQLASVSKIKEEKDIQINKMQQDLIKAESKLASSKSTVALLCKSAEEKESDAQRESALACISVRSQEIHEVLLQVKEQNQVDVDEILKTIRSELRRALDSQIIPTKSSLTSDKETDESNNEPDAEHFVQNVLSEAFATTFCT